MKTVRIKTKYKTSLSSYWAFLFKERWRHFNFHYGFCRKARVIKCSPFIIAKMGLIVQVFLEQTVETGEENAPSFCEYRVSSARYS